MITAAASTTELYRYLGTVLNPYLNSRGVLLSHGGLILVVRHLEQFIVNLMLLFGWATCYSLRKRQKRTGCENTFRRGLL